MHHSFKCGVLSTRTCQVRIGRWSEHSLGFEPRLFPRNGKFCVFVLCLPLSWWLQMFFSTLLMRLSIWLSISSLSAWVTLSKKIWLVDDWSEEEKCRTSFVDLPLPLVEWEWIWHILFLRCGEEYGPTIQSFRIKCERLRNSTFSRSSSPIQWDRVHRESVSLRRWTKMLCHSGTLDWHLRWARTARNTSPIHPVLWPILECEEVVEVKLSSCPCVSLQDITLLLFVAKNFCTWRCEQIFSFFSNTYLCLQWLSYYFSEGSSSCWKDERNWDWSLLQWRWRRGGGGRWIFETKIAFEEGIHCLLLV